MEASPLLWRTLDPTQGLESPNAIPGLKNTTEMCIRNGGRQVQATKN